MRQSQWRGGHARTVASGPSSTTTDLCPFTSHHKTRSWPLDKRPVSPGQASWRLALAPLAATKWYQLWKSRPSTQAQRKQIHPEERSAGVREAFHRERVGEPKASSTRRRACTGGQRQSYKRVGYLTRSSGWVSQGQAGTATEPRNSSWRDPRCFLEGKAEAAAARVPLRTTTTTTTTSTSRAKQPASRHPGAQRSRRAWFLFLDKLV